MFILNYYFIKHKRNIDFSIDQDKCLEKLSSSYRVMIYMLIIIQNNKRDQL